MAYFESKLPRIRSVNIKVCLLVSKIKYWMYAKFLRFFDNALHLMAPVIVHKLSSPISSVVVKAKIQRPRTRPSP